MAVLTQQQILSFLAIDVGYGYGNGSGNGNGDGYGNGSGYGNGDGDGYGNGNGDGIQEFDGHELYDIDGVPTAITSIRGNIARGFILERNVIRKPCFIVKEQDKFAHGGTLRDAFTSLQEKLYDDSTEEERIAAFKSKFPSYDTPYPQPRPLRLPPRPHRLMPHGARAVRREPRHRHRRHYHRPQASRSIRNNRIKPTTMRTDTYYLDTGNDRVYFNVTDGTIEVRGVTPKVPTTKLIDFLAIARELGFKAGIL